MPRDIGPVLCADERLDHQVADTFATISSSDLSWTEKIWITMARRDGSLQVDAGIGKYPNRGVIDGFGGIARGPEQWTVRASRELSQAPEEAAVGPLRYEVIEPLKSVRFVLEANDAIPLRYDLRFDASMPVFFEDRHLDREVNRVTSNIVRYHQPGSVSGWVEIDGQRVEVRPEEWFAFRDHSWGIRGAVGARPGDLAPRPTDGARKFHMQWSPILMTRPDGSLYEVQYYFIQTGDYMRHFTAHINSADGSQERVVAVSPEITYAKSNRDLVGGQIVLTTEAGEKRILEIEPISETGFRLHPALYGEWKGAQHGTWRGPLHVEGERIENCDQELDARMVPVWQLRDRPLRVREGDSQGFGILESMCFGDFPQFGVPAP
ncbi:MAG: hypothetical protein IT303_12060 [Dehalococcoidia bacterium]|nr:hypothetical protein [Dehalococcoidia bacterium]